MKSETAKEKWIVVGGNPIRVYTGTTTFTGFHELGQFKTEEEANKCVKENYDSCGGLINMFKVLIN